MAESPYVVLSGGYDTRNVGDYAMLELFAKLARRRGLETRVLVRHADEILRQRYGVAELIPNFEYPNRSESEGKFFRGFNAGDDRGHLEKLRRVLEGASGLYLGGGRLLLDQTLDVMRGPLSYFSSLVTLARFLGVPVHLYAMTIVPNRTPAGERWLRFIVENCDSVAVRDPESLDHLRAIGCETGQWEVLADPAFALAWPQSPLESKRVALSVRFIHAGWGGLSEAAYLDRMAGVVRALQARGREVVGIPHQFYGIDQPNYDDRVVLSKIAERTPFEFIRDPWLDLDRYRDFYAGCEALVGIRRHSFLFAAAAGVPVLAFAENPNASRACRDFDGHAPLGLDLGQEGFERSLDAFLDSKSAWRDRQNTAFRRQADGLAGRYANALFGSAMRSRTERLGSVLASQNPGCPA